MKKILLAAVLISFVAVGCGVKSTTTFPPPEDPYAVLDTAWTEYDGHNFSTAKAKFEKVIRMDNTIPEAHLGLAWSEVALNRPDLAQSAFSFAMILSGGSMAQPVFHEIILPTDTNRYWFEIDTVGGTVDTFTVVELQHRPIIGVSSASINYVNQTLREITDSTITIAAELAGDSLTGPRLKDTLVVNYFIFRDVSDTSSIHANLFAHIGTAVAAASNTEGKYLMTAIAYANAAVMHRVPESFAHYPYIDEIGTRLVLAESYFWSGLMANCVRELKIIDPTWTFDGDPYDPDNYWIILNKLNEEIGSN